MRRVKFCLVLFSLFVFNSSFAIEIDLPSIFSNGMVLQRGQKVPIWGKTEANAAIKVKFAGQVKTGIANNKGEWMVNLDPLKASSESNTIAILSEHDGKSTQVNILDVLVGEVWLCGGQSNMYRPFRMLTGEAVEPKYEPVAEFLRQEAATANDPLFRQFKVGPAYSVLEEANQNKGNWSKAIQGQVNEFSGTAYFFGKELRKELNVPIAIISCNLGGTQIQPWMPKAAFNTTKSMSDYYTKEIDDYKKNVALWDETAEQIKYKQAMADWEIKKDQANNKVAEPSKPEHPSRNKQLPATLYNAMIHPLIPFAIKGTIWYQGESNSSRLPEEYGQRLSALIQSWRDAWGQGNFYFYCCQLANYRTPNAEPVGDDDGWAVLSNSQQEILKLPNTGMAVLNDIGEAKDIHPKNKFDTGKRLSLWALKQAYGKDIVCSGPLYKSSKIVKNKMIIEFDNVGSGLMVGKKDLMNPVVKVDEPLKRFQICDSTGKWKWAKAQILDKNKVQVWNDEILNPIEVRYAWSSNPEGANLYNQEGLPASIFKTKNENK